jgi:hypothetical protein
MRTCHLLLDVLDPSAGICNHVSELSEHCGQRIDVDVFGDVDLVLSGNPLVFHSWTNWKWVCGSIDQQSRRKVVREIVFLAGSSANIHIVIECSERLTSSPQRKVLNIEPAAFR